MPQAWFLYCHDCREKFWADESLGHCPTCGKECGRKVDRPKESPRELVLLEAIQAVTKDRNAEYGPPEDNFDDIAQMWKVYLKGRNPATIDNIDVANMMVLIKVARARTSKRLRDHYVDIAGYAACGYQCVESQNE